MGVSPGILLKPLNRMLEIAYLLNISETRYCWLDVVFWGGCFIIVILFYFISLHFISLHFIAFHCTALHFILFYFILFYFIFILFF